MLSNTTRVVRCLTRYCIASSMYLLLCSLLINKKWEPKNNNTNNKIPDKSLRDPDACVVGNVFAVTTTNAMV